MFNIKDVKYAFFGSSEFSVFVLDELEKQEILPSLIVTTPDKPKGRGLEITETPVKTWAKKRNIEVLSPIKLSEPDLISKLSTFRLQLFLVASYGKIIPSSVFNIPEFKTLNIHPSLLPKLRGASPVQTSILNNMKDEIGVTIMKIDEKMDHGPIVAQERVNISNWPINTYELKKILAEYGARLFVKILPEYLNNEIGIKAQDESLATFTRKIEKNDGLLDLNAEPIINLLKVKAYSIWPHTYFFTEIKGRKIRVVVKDAEIIDGKFVPKIVIPEGKREMKYSDFQRGLKN